METVFLLWHVHEFHDPKDRDEKLIGAYRTEEDAKAAIIRLADKPGFREAPAGFHISEVRPKQGPLDGGLQGCGLKSRLSRGCYEDDTNCG